MGFYRYDGLLYKISSRVSAVIVANLMFLFSGLFIITMPAAIVALCAVSDKFLDGDYDSVLRAFRIRFFETFKRSIILGAPLGVMGTSLLLDFHIVNSADTRFKFLFLGLLIFVSYSYTVFVLHIFPLASVADSQLRQLLDNTVKLSLFKPLFTFMIIGLIYCLIYASFHYGVMFLVCSFAVIAFLSSWMVRIKLKSIQSGRVSQ